MRSEVQLLPSPQKNLHETGFVRRNENHDANFASLFFDKLMKATYVIVYDCWLEVMNGDVCLEYRKRG
ncbi:MAG: hypothetical protein EBR93_00410 [Bacteroidetes bacterium]|nr:hypothetical protein [Bacteroidota bacterium]